MTVTALGLRRAVHGNPLAPAHLVGHSIPPVGDLAGRPVRVLDESGALVALAHARGGALHPVVVIA